MCLWMSEAYFVDVIIHPFDVIPSGLVLSVDVGHIPPFTIEDYFKLNSCLPHCLGEFFSDVLSKYSL